MKVDSQKILNSLEDAQRKRSDTLEKLSSGTVFTSADPRPSERAIAEGLEFRLRSLSASKRNVNDAISLLQTAESSMSEINNMVSRMKEINVAAASTTMTDRERRYLFIEYQALHDEMTRIAETTEFNGIPLLNGASDKAPETLIFRLDAPFSPEGGSPDIEDDLSVISFEGIKSVVATAEGLGIQSAAEILVDATEEEGVSIEDVAELMVPEDEDLFSTVYDEALARLSTQRAIFGGMQERMNRALDFIDVYQENIAAAKSKIADTDYAREVVNLAQQTILTQASTGVLAQSNFNSALTLNLLSSLGI